MTVTDIADAVSADVLFRPLQVGAVTLKNRIVMAPMTRGMAPEGIPGAGQVAYYQRRAAAEVGLILSEGTVIDRPASRNMPGIPFFYGEPALAGWQQVIAAVHAAGGRMGPQLWHTGSIRAGEWEPEAEVESPSGLEGPGKPRGRAMTDEDIADTIAAFAKGAADAKRLGFDVAELHGAHSYLIDQFFWSETNRRDDRWGGASLPQRSRFALEVVRAVRAAVGPGFPILLRISQWKQQDYQARLATSPDELGAWLNPLADAGVDVFHCSQRRFWEPEFAEIDGSEGLNLAGWVKKLTGKLTISVGSVGLSSDFTGAFQGQSANATSVSGLLRRMERDEFDLIAVGRSLLADPQWAAKLKRGAVDEFTGFAPSALGSLV